MPDTNVQPCAPTLFTDAELSYLVRLPLKATTPSKALILLHGVGSNEQDLFRYAAQLPDEFLIISPRGYYTLSAGRYAWYQVDFSTGKPIVNEEQEAQSRKAILQFILEIKQKYKIDEVYLGGFSQGAIMSYSIGLTNPEQVMGVVALSGRILHEINSLVKPNNALRQLKFFISHGVDDKTLPVTYAREAKAYVEQLGVQLFYHEFEMGHQIIPDVVTALVQFLRS